MAKTIYDVAKAADVSIATVSRVFNNTNNVKESTRQKVIQIADEMGYHPHAYAQGLASKKTNNIMMLAPVMSNYFFTEVLKGAQDMLDDHNIELTIVNINQGQGVFSQVDRILKRRWADGYLLASLHLKDHELRKLKKYHVPISLLDDFSTDFDSVSFDNEKSAYVATRHLLDKGYRNIVFLSGKTDTMPIQQRVKGYEKAMVEFGLPFDETMLITGDTMDRDGFTEKNGYEAMKKILKKDPMPDACFCTSDIKAIGAMKAMKEENNYIPLVSCDNLSISEYIGLSTIHQPMYHMGRQATRYLLERIHKPGIKKRDDIYDPKLIIRSSSEV